MKVTAVLLLAAACVMPVLAQQAKAPAELPPDSRGGWSIKSFQFPATQLALGFLNGDRTTLKAPLLPALESTAEDGAAYLQASDQIVTQYLAGMGVMLPPGSLAAFDPHSFTLAIRSDHQTLQKIADLAREFAWEIPFSLQFTINLIEAEEGILRRAGDETMGKADHSPQLAKLQELVRKGAARQVDTVCLDCSSSGTGFIERGEVRQVGTSFVGVGNSGRNDGSEKRQAGTRIKLNPYVGSDRRTIDLLYQLEYHYLAPVDRWEAVTGSGTETVEVKLTDFFTLEIESDETLVAGEVRLLGIWKPEGLEDASHPQVLIGAFLRADILPLLTAVNPRVAEIIRLYGETVRPAFTSIPTVKVEERVPDGMARRIFRVSPEFFATHFAPPPPSDPLGFHAEPGPPEVPQRKSAMDVLREAGIEFPPGAWAEFKASSGEVIVQNNQKNLTSAMIYFASNGARPAESLTFALHVMQIGSSFARDLEEELQQASDHTSVWQRVTHEVALGRGKFVHSLRLSSKSGKRASTRVGGQYSYVDSATFDFEKSNDKASGAPMKIQVAPGGPLSVEVHPDVEDLGIGLLVDASISPHPHVIQMGYHLKFHYAPPTVRPFIASKQGSTLRLDAPTTSFHSVTFSSGMSLASGTTRLVGLWKPEGTPEFDKADLVQMAFLRADVDRTDLPKE